MILFIARRLAQSLVVVVVVTLIVFVLSRTTGDPANLLLPLDVSEEQRLAFAAKWGLDRPLYEQYVTWLLNVAQGDLGTSYRARIPVTDLLAERLPNSAFLALTSLLIAAMLGVVTGVLAAVRRGTWVDSALRLFAIVGQGVPAFWLGLILQATFALHLPIFPVSGAGSPAAVVLPGVTLGWFVSAGIMRLVRSSMIAALTSDYVLLVRTKGISEGLVVWKHALRNALIAPVTFLGLYFGILIGSAVVVETIFAYPGIGMLAYQAVLTRDFPTLQGVILLTTVIVVAMSFLTDVTYAVIDPRTREAS